MFKTIILAVDGSESAGRALEMAASLARKDEAAITVVNAYQRVSPLLGSPNYQSRVKHVLTLSEELVEKAEQQLLAQGVTSIEKNVLEGPPSLAIIAAAKVRDADLIVMGSRGLTPVKGLLLGSVSERVLGMATCPVLVVP